MDNIEKLADSLASLTPAELRDLIKVLKDKYHLEAIAPAVPKVEEAEVIAVEEKKTAFKVNLVKTSDVTTERLGAVKIVNRILNIGLKEANNLTKTLPVTIIDNVPAVEAEALKAEFAAVNAEITLN